MADIHDITRERDQRAAEQVRPAKAGRGFEVSLDICDVNLVFSTEVKPGKEPDQDRIRVIGHDLSRNPIVHYVAIRMTRAQLREFAKFGNGKPPVKAPPEFPLYLMVIDGKKRFMPLREAGVNYDSGWAKVEVGGLVLESDMRVREITKEEEKRISEIADAYSESK